METQQGNNFVRGLTFEYIRQNNLLSCEKDKIINKIDEIVEIQNIIHDCVRKRYHDFKFL